MPLIVPKNGVLRAQVETPVRCTDCGFMSGVTVKVEAIGIPTDNPKMLRKIAIGLMKLTVGQMEEFLKSHQACPEHKNGQKPKPLIEVSSLGRKV